MASLTGREEAEFRERVREYASVYVDEVGGWDARDRVDLQPLMKRAREFELTGLILDPEYGGRGLGAWEWTIAIEEIAQTAMNWLPADPLFMTSGPGPGMILASDNDELKRDVLPQLVNGEAMAAINICEPDAGSAMTDLSTTVRFEGDEMIVNGRKRHVTGGGICEYLSTFCRFEGAPPGAKGIGAVLIERDREGIEYGPNPEWFGLRGVPHVEVTMTDVRIPRRNLLFGPGQFNRLMGGFNLERLHNAILSLGFAQAALDMACEFVLEREQFGRPLVEFQGVQWQIADMYVDVQAARALVYSAARNAAEGKYPSGLDISVAKIYANEMGIRVARMATDLHGAIGYTKQFPLERLLRDCLIMPIAGGTPNIQRNTIAAQIFKGYPLSQRRPSPVREVAR